MRIRTLAAASVVAALVGLPATSDAQESAATIEGLFVEGKRLVAEGKLGLACPKFLASYELEHRVGTLLNLADCYEKNGQLASAYARYLEAKPLTARVGQEERLAFATAHAAALEPKLARLTIVVPGPMAGLEVKRDGVLVEPAKYGTDVPVDVGNHVVTASAPGKRAWSANAAIAKDGEKQTVNVPRLTDAVAAPPDRTPPGNGKLETPPPVEESAGTSGRTIAGLVITGVGIASLAVGTGFGIAALSKDGESTLYCGQNGASKNDCFGDGVGYRSDAVSNGNVSTVFFLVGSALVTGGLILWLTDPSRKPNTAALRHPGLVF